MKNILTMGTVALAVSFLSITATASESNKIMKTCLHINGYTVEQFDTFDWSKAAACHSAYRVGNNLQQLAEMRHHTITGIVCILRRSKNNIKYFMISSAIQEV